VTDLDRMVTATLARVAEDDVHVERLLARATADGLRYRRRRRSRIAAGAALSVVAAGVGIALTATLLPVATGGPPPPAASRAAPSTVDSAKPSPSWAPPQAMTRLPALPPAAGAPGALGDPGQVGRPMLLHVGVDVLPFPVEHVQYLASGDGERLYLQGRPDGAAGPSRLLTVRLARTTRDFEPLDGAQTPVVVGGRPGTFATEPRYNTGTLRWRLANGLWLQVTGHVDQAQALAVAGGVRLDRAYRCAVPFRLPAVPPGARAETCTMSFSGGAAPSGGITVAIGASHVTVTADPGDGPGAGRTNETLGGRPARVLEHAGDGGRSILEIHMGLGNGIAMSLTAEGSYDGAVVRGLAANLEWVGGADPATWPADPLG
jgi:hypothetical protein